MNNKKTIFNKFSLKQLRKTFSLFLLFAIVFTSYPNTTFAQGIELIPRENDVLAEETTGSDQVKDDLESIESLLNHTGNTGQNNIVAPELGLFTLADRTVPNSAAFYVKAKFRTLSKKSYKAIEQVEIVIDNAKADELKITIFDPDGNEVKVDKEIVSAQFPTVLEINPPKNDFKPGRYRITVEESNGDVSTQDFTWGVLAINPNKAVYLPGEDAHFSIAVLDETGQMVCDAKLILNITHSASVRQAQDKSSGQENQIANSGETLSTEDGSIKVSKECQFKGFTQVPDYEAIYNLPSVGNYDLNLLATTKNGTYSVNSNLQVREEVAFDIERSTATRIYPYEKYPVEISVTANQDFEGTIEEIVPGSFEIEGESNASVLGENTFDASSSAETNQKAQIQIDTSFSRIEEYSKDKEEVTQQQPVNQIGLPFKGDFEISQGFGGDPDDPVLAKKYKDYGVIGHDGVDFETPFGTEVVAADDGTVARARENYDYGTTIVIEHSWGKSYYGHLSQLKVKEGDSVKKGAVIGLSGSTGLSTGPHLHFGIKLNENNPDNGYYGKINPMPYITDSLIARNDKYSQVLGAQTKNNIEYKKIIWNVNVKKGDKITLSYKYKAPLISPQFYLIGPAVFKDTKGEIVFNEGRRWQIAADAVSPDGWGIYADTSDDDIKLQKLTNPTTWGSEVDTTQGTGANDIYWTVTVHDPTSTEVSTGYIDEDGALFVLRCTGTCDTAGNWSELFSVTGVGAAAATTECLASGPTACNKPFDIAYEQLTGRLLIAYGKLTSNDQFFYQIYNNGSQVTGETSVTNAAFLLGTNNAGQISIQARGERLAVPRTNQILLTAASDTGTSAEVSAAIWSGSAWGNFVNITATTKADACDNRPCADGAWETVSGDASVVWTDTATDFRYRRFTSSDTTWAAEATTGVTRATTGDNPAMYVASDPASNRILLSTFNDTGDDFRPGVWKANGSTASWTTGTNDDTAESANGVNAIGIWERFSNHAIWMYSENTLGTTDTAIETATCDGTGCTFTITDIADNSTNDTCGATGDPDDSNGFGAGASWNSDEVMFLFNDIDEQLWDRQWTGSAISSAPTACREVTLPVAVLSGGRLNVVQSFTYIPYAPWSRNWRWYDGNDGSGEPSTPTATEALAAENTAPTGISSSGKFLRLRFQYAERGGMAETDTRKKLQYTSGCTPTSSETACTWTDVDDAGGSGIWRYKDIGCTATDCADGVLLVGTTLTGSDGTCTAGNGCGTWVMDKDAAASTSMDHNAAIVQESEWVIETNGATEDTVYYFRTIDVFSSTVNGVGILREQDADDCGAGSAQCTYPSLTVSAGGAETPSLSQLMRHGNWFNSAGAEQPFTF